MSKSVTFIILGVCIFVTGISLIIIYSSSQKTQIAGKIPDTIFTESELKQYNGDNPDKPIYLGLNGFIYDVTKGKEFYEANGPYHYLAGKDSSTELNLIGGNIIKKKYPIIGKLKK